MNDEKDEKNGTTTTTVAPLTTTVAPAAASYDEDHLASLLGGVHKGEGEFIKSVYEGDEFQITTDVLTKFYLISELTYSKGATFSIDIKTRDNTASRSGKATKLFLLPASTLRDKTLNGDPNNLFDHGIEYTDGITYGTDGTAVEPRSDCSDPDGCGNHWVTHGSLGVLDIARPALRELTDFDFAASQDFITYEFQIAASGVIHYSMSWDRYSSDTSSGKKRYVIPTSTAEEVLAISAIGRAQLWHIGVVVDGGCTAEFKNFTVTPPESTT